MVINIPTTRDKIFKQYLSIINTLLSDKHRLTNIEINVLEKMLYIDNLYKHLPKDKRDIIIFHKSTREKIKESLFNMSINSFNNILSKLRTKGMITTSSLKINVPIIDNKIRLEFNLEIDDTKKS